MMNNDLRNKIIGLGENSFKKSYYPELKNKVEELELFHQIFEKTNDIVIVIDPASRLIKYTNNSVANHFWNNENYVNLPVEQLLGIKFTEKLSLFEKDENENKVIIEIEYQEKKYALEAVLNTIDISGKNKIVAIIRDITDHLQAQKELEKQNEKLQESNSIIKSINKELITAKEKAEESDKLKSAFLANMSHEIRTPMNAIIGFSNLLARHNLPEEKKNKYTEIINSSGNQLLNIISDIVDISKIEAGQLNISYAEININQILDELFTQFNLEIKQNKPDISLKLVKDLSNENAWIISDPDRMKQVFINLLNNALKFTQQGGIEFGYTIKNSDKIIFFCKDTGIGVPTECHQIIFERFRQSDNTNSDNYGGTGLGLSITKGIVELMNGKIHIESDEGKGAHFWFELPYHSKKKTKMVELENIKRNELDWSNKTILIAEDEDFNFYFLQEVLATTHVNILRAKTGKEAVKIFEENPSVKLILMDLKMPIMNGFEATKVIKQQNNKIPIIAQTAYALAGDRENALETGCDEYISKPIDKDTLIALLARFILA